MKHFGNVCNIDGKSVEPVDIITFGAPCQDLSVAGKRSGLKHVALGDDETTRSGLFFEAIRIIKEMREATNGTHPRFAIYENVPGAFSSNKGHDFHAVLEALCSVCDDTVSIPEPYDAKRTKLVWDKAGEIVGDDYSVAWRTLDAQYWGVPQRRKRIYLVADFTGRRAGEILFKPDSLRGYMPQGNETGQGSTADAVGSVDGSVGVECLNPWDCQSKRIYNPDGIYCTLPAMDCGGANNQAVIFSFDSLSSNSMKSSNPFSGCRAVEIAKCIDTTYPDPSKNQGGVAVVQPVIALQANGIDRADTAGCNGAGWRENESYTLNTVDRHAVAFQLSGDRSNPSVSVSEDKSYCVPANPMSDRGQAVCYDARNHNAQDISGTIQAKSNGGQSLNYINPVCYDARRNGDGETACTITGDHQNRITDYTAVAVQEAKPPRRYIIRRLTPTECARLQGFPDNWGQLAPYDPADADFWEDVRKTHAEINGKKYKPVKNLKAWYDKLHTDSAEYKAYGNGLALPCAEYVIHGIAEQGAKTLGSLFDGIGGFPLAGVLNGIKPVWASEIEPYPIAVTVSRFGIENAPTESQLR